MSARGVLTCIGFPGWGPLQLLIPTPAAPPAFAARLRRAIDGTGGAAPPAALLPALLRSQRDLTPLRPPAWRRQHHLPDSRPIVFHYRLVCLPGSPAPLRITAWARGEESQRWHLLWSSRSVLEFLAAAGGGRKSGLRTRAEGIQAHGCFSPGGWVVTGGRRPMG